MRNLILAVIASIAFYGIWVLIAGPDQVWEEVKRLGWLGWFIILGLSLFNYLLRFGRWQLYLQRLGYHVPAWPNFRFYLAGFAFTATPGKVGEVVRSLYLKRYNVKYTDSIAAFFVERLVDVVAMVLLSLLAAYVFEEWRWLIAIVSALLILLLPLLRSPWLFEMIRRFQGHLSSAKLLTMIGHLLSLLESSSVLLRSGSLYAGLGLGVLAWAAEGMALYVVVQLLGIDISAPLAVGIYGVSILVGALSFVPAGLGSTEVVMGALLILVGLAEPVAVSAVLICRVATLWFAVAIGLIAALELELGHAGRFAMVNAKQGDIS
ncbi:MAG: lysylphosphatidylglycerol synthase transmembrane domain-containing protein [Gammaproteobacteria bacterium]|nr:lysylphosphatidylglycerol synthase transmembrane domain-containing protein [Gammaproteobacteria bacterium]